MPQENYVVKIQTSLSNKPIFVKINTPEMSVDRIFSEAVQTLNNTGRPLEASQLEQLYDHHQIFNAGNTVEKGNLFKELIHSNQNVGDQNVLVAELDLIASHSGGY